MALALFTLALFPRALLGEPLPSLVLLVLLRVATKVRLDLVEVRVGVAASNLADRVWLAVGDASSRVDRRLLAAGLASAPVGDLLAEAVCLPPCGRAARGKRP
ncbi:MAG: hypothetical protein KF764_29530, partial [Labilithrix sp.]|nr:hypothetical protein [Labilithrix sp.]